MDPTLTPLPTSDFSAVIEFLNAGEYEPVLLLQEPPASFPSSSASTSHSQEKSEYILDDSTSPIDYSKELIRSARLINLAKKFQLPAFAACVFRKVLFGHPDNKYDIKAFLEFARIVLGNQVQDQDLLSAHTDTAPPPGEAQAKDTKPSIFHTVSSWTITFLAENMEAITCSLDRRDVSGFWGVMKLGRGDRWVEKRVLEVRLEIGRKWPGGRVKVEGD